MSYPPTSDRAILFIPTTESNMKRSQALLKLIKTRALTEELLQPLALSYSMWIDHQHVDSQSQQDQIINIINNRASEQFKAMYSDIFPWR